MPIMASTVPGAFGKKTRTRSSSGTALRVCTACAYHRARTTLKIKLRYKAERTHVSGRLERSEREGGGGELGGRDAP